MNFADRIAQKIKAEKITPIAPWYFSFKNWIFWISFVFSIFLGTIAFAMLLVAIIQNEFVFSWLSEMLWLPFIWLFVFIIFLGSSWYAVHHTKSGYKIPSWIWIISNIAVSIVLGTVVYFVSMTHFDNEMMKFSGMKHSQEKFWSRPEEGFLSGTLELQNEQLVLVDFNNQIWHISFSPKVQKKHPALFMQLQKQQNKELFLPPHPIKLKGKLKDNFQFEVDDIKPFARGPLRQEEMRFVPISTPPHPPIFSPPFPNDTP